MFQPFLIELGFGVDTHPNNPDVYIVTKHGRRYSPPGRSFIFETPDAAERAAVQVIKEIREAEQREENLLKGEPRE